MKTYILIIYAFFIFTGKTFAQHIRGNVKGIDGDKKEILLPGANVYWQESMQGTVTDEHGDFELHAGVTLPSRLIVSFIGYRPDTVLVADASSSLNIQLISELVLDEYILSQKRGANFYSKVTPFQVQVLTSCELKKAACCNLSESFETNASVDVSFSDALTGAKQIELLGLAGTYTQMQFENIPSIRGLSAPYGMTYVPGPWLESIQISKGTSSVRNGFESITGQINYEYLKPDKSEKFYLNLFGNQTGRSELNVYSARKFNDKWSNMLFVHGNYLPFKVDHNDDQFMDMPLQRQINLFYRLKYNAENMMSQFGVGFMDEVKEGGQLSFVPAKDKGTTNAYGLGIDTRRLELFWKAGFMSEKHENRSLALFTSATFHQMNSFFGLKNYDAGQTSYYFNSIFKDHLFEKENHEIALGFSMIADIYDEKLNDSIFTRKDYVPGLFAEYTFELQEKFTLIAGLRDDYHLEYGNLITPRLHIRYMINDKNIIRVSAGKGYRFPHIIAENMSVLASSKSISFSQDAKIEEAWNYGVFYTRDIDVFKKEFKLNLDFYRTDFVNQVVVDLNSASKYIYVYNLDGRSYANSFQAEVTFELIRRLDVMLAYRFNDVKTTYNGILTEKVLSKKSKGVMTLSYATKRDKWRFDATLQYNGVSRLPVLYMDDIPAPVEYSPSYVIANTQITKNFKKWELYAGVENLTDYVQKNPIIDPENPFGQNFDASRIWGPVFGRKIYAGLRWMLK